MAGAHSRCGGAGKATWGGRGGGGIGDQIPLDIGHMGVFDSHLAKAIGSRGKMLGTGRAGGVIRAPGEDVTLPAARG